MTEATDITQSFVSWRSVIHRRPPPGMGEQDVGAAAVDGEERVAAGHMDGNYFWGLDLEQHR